MSDRYGEELIQAVDEALEGAHRTAARRQPRRLKTRAAAGGQRRATPTISADRSSKGRLVARFTHIEGYRVLSLTRASSVVKRQSAAA